MRSSTRRALSPRLARVMALGAIATSALVWSGCDAKKQTEYVTGVSTQVQVPRDLKAVRLDVSVGGSITFCRGYPVYNGKVELPRSLGQIPAGEEPSSEPLTITVSGYTEDFNRLDGLDIFANCQQSPPKIGAESARILRRSRQPYVKDAVLFLPMPLKYSCYDNDPCKAEHDNDESWTCKAGRCVQSTIDPTTLPAFTEELLSGTGGNCFSTSTCFAAGIPPVVVNADDCTFAIPNTPSSPPVGPGNPANPLVSAGEGINVEVTYDGGYNREILDKDPEEGFIIPDPAKPQQFRLSAGLCDLYKGVTPGGDETAHRITALRATGVCKAKSPFQPLCVNDLLAAMGTPEGISANPTPPSGCTAKSLRPAESALLLLADDSENNAIFYTGGEGGTGSDVIANSDLVNYALSDPAFRNTRIGLSYFPGKAGATCTGHLPLDIDFKIAKDARPLVVSSFAALKAPGSLKPLGGQLNLRGALDEAYTAMKSAAPTANKRAVFVIGNRGFDSADCGGTVEARVSDARTVDKIDTYVALLARDKSVPDTTPPPVIARAQEVAVAGRAPSIDPANPVRVFDARKDKEEAQKALRQIVDDLATCAYDVTEDPKVGAKLSYSDPTALPGVQKAFYTIDRDNLCTSAGTAGNGFNYDPVTKRIHVCGKACADYRTVLKSAAAYGALYQKPALAVPLFSHQPGCDPK